MGLSSSKTKAETKPVYSSQIEGAAGTINSAYAAQAPKLTAITDSIGSLAPGLVERFTQGDSGINAARGYDADVLGGKYLNGSPQLDAIVSQTGNGVRNGLAASLGTRGLTGGSAFGDIISRALAENETRLRYADYGNERQRQESAAGRAPALAASQYLPLQSLIDIATAQNMPLQSAVGAGSGIGGLLGQYTNSTQKTSGNIGQLIAGLGGSLLSGWASGGFSGLGSSAGAAGSAAVAPTVTSIGTNGGYIPRTLR